MKVGKVELQKKLVEYN